MDKRRRRLPAGPQAHRGGDLDDVGPAVVGVGPGRDVPPPEPIDVHDRHDRPPPPRPSGHDVGDRDERPAVGLDPQQVDREARSRPSASRSRTERCPQVAAAQTHRSGRAASCSAASASVGDVDHVGGDGRPGSPQSSPGRIVIRRAGGDHAVGDDAAERLPCRVPRPVARLGVAARPSATWRARSTSCFIVRTKSPPVSSSSPTTSASPSPATHAWAAATNPGSGGRCSASPPRALVGGEVLADRDDPPPAVAGVRSTGTTAAAAARGCGARTRTPTAARPASPCRARRTRRRARTRRPAGRSRGTPATAPRRARSASSRRRRRSPRRSSTSSTWSNSRASDWPWPSTRAAEVGELALQPLDLAGRPHPLAQVGVRLDGVRPVGDPVPRRPAPAAAAWCPLSARATSLRYSARFGLNTVGSRTVPIERGTSAKSSGVSSSRSARGVTVVRRIPPLRWALATTATGPR